MRTRRPTDKNLFFEYTPGMEAWQAKFAVLMDIRNKCLARGINESNTCLKQSWDVLHHLEHSPKRNTSHEGNGTYKGPFAFTITTSPKWGKTVLDMVNAANKVMTQQSNKVKRFAWYYEDKGRDEGGDPIHPHIHGMYETETGGRIEIKHWRRAWTHWGENKADKVRGMGFEGGYHRPIHHGEEYNAYIKKDGGMSASFGVSE